MTHFPDRESPTGTARPRSHAFIAIEDRVEGTRMMLSVTRALLEAGRRVDLAGLDGDVARLCTSILALPGSDRETLRPALEELRAQVECLQDALTAA